ncbi:hypothetical protein HRS9139_05979 [Pyrenophora teres f. teres]|nr:hypothetical protein HRS9139_05979 [Pyrenophora teres f. teres]
MADGSSFDIRETLETPRKSFGICEVEVYRDGGGGGVKETSGTKTRASPPPERPQLRESSYASRANSCGTDTFLYLTHDDNEDGETQRRSRRHHSGCR